MGYLLYLDLIAPLIRETRSASQAPLREESARAEYAIQAARSGKRVAVIAGGDACVYGIGGWCWRPVPAARHPRDRRAGVTAANAACGRPGVPPSERLHGALLSDILTARRAILRKVKAAADSDIAVALYNPRSRSRRDLLGTALGNPLAARGPATPWG